MFKTDPFAEEIKELEKALKAVYLTFPELSRYFNYADDSWDGAYFNCSPEVAFYPKTTVSEDGRKKKIGWCSVHFVAYDYKGNPGPWEYALVIDPLPARDCVWRTVLGFMAHRLDEALDRKYEEEWEREEYGTEDAEEEAEE